MIKTGEILAGGALLCRWKLEPQGRTVICSSCFNLAVCTQDSSPSIGWKMRGYHAAGRLSVAGLSFVIREKCRLACFLLPLPCSLAEGCLQVSTDKWWEPHTHKYKHRHTFDRTGLIPLSGVCQWVGETLAWILIARQWIPTQLSRIWGSLFWLSQH